MIETISDGGTVLSYLIRGGPLPEQTTFLTPDDCNLQVGHVVYPAGGEVARHVHLPIERRIVGTTEVLIVERGRCEVDIYSADRRLIATRQMQARDILVTVTGGHSFRAVDDLVLLEVKQGPYPGGAEKERW